MIAVQEVDRLLPRSGGTDQVEELARRLGRHGVFAPALLGDPQRGWVAAPADGTDPGGPAYGVGLLSRFVLRDPVRVPLPGGSRVGPGRRWAAGWDREPRVALHATVDEELAVATTHLSWAAWRAVRQLRHVVRLVDRVGRPAVLLGDLNLPLHALAPALLGTGWRPTPAGPTFPARYPVVQLDHVLLRSGVGVAAVPRGVDRPSDHLVVRAGVTLP